jgi:catechol 2,3-dioxygenase-like lactoylglutathione lyase family enzyme
MQPRAILEAALYVDDLDAALAFYGGVLGLDVVGRLAGRHLFFRVGGGILLIFRPEATEVADPGARLPVPPHGAYGPGHLCLAATRDEIAAWRARLLAAGVAIETEFDWPNGARSIYFRDPAGNSLEFAEPRLWDG